jgi:hypothetical protein
VKSTHSSGTPSGAFARKSRVTGAICRSDADAATPSGPAATRAAVAAALRARHALTAPGHSASQVN